MPMYEGNLSRREYRENRDSSRDGARKPSFSEHQYYTKKVQREEIGKILSKYPDMDKKKIEGFQKKMV